MTGIETMELPFGSHSGLLRNGRPRQSAEYSEQTVDNLENWTIRSRPRRHTRKNNCLCGKHHWRDFARDVEAFAAGKQLESSCLCHTSYQGKHSRCRRGHTTVNSSICWRIQVRHCARCIATITKDLVTMQSVCLWVSDATVMIRLQVVSRTVHVDEDVAQLAASRNACIGELAFGIVLKHHVYECRI